MCEAPRDLGSSGEDRDLQRVSEILGVIRPSLDVAGVPDIAGMRRQSPRITETVDSGVPSS